MKERKSLSTAEHKLSALMKSNKAEYKALACLHTHIKIILDQGYCLSAEIKALTADTSQMDIIKLVKKTEKSSVFFTLESTKALVYQVKTFKKTKEYERYLHLLNEIEECATSTIAELQERKTDITDDTSLSVDEKDIFISTQLHNGKYLPFNQSKDPLIGKIKLNDSYNDSPGNCYGHVMQWRDALLTGQYALIPRLNPTTLSYQIKQESVSSEWQSAYTHALDLIPLVENLIKKLKPYLIYELSFDWGDDVAAHSTGLRLLPISGEIEFFDSNFGLFVFPNKDKFQGWFAWLLNRYYCSTAIQLSLCNIGMQKLGAMPSIPLGGASEITQEDVTLFALHEHLLALKKNYHKLSFDSHSILIKMHPLIKSIENPIHVKSELVFIIQEMKRFYLKLYQRKLLKGIMQFISHRDGEIKSMNSLFAAIKPFLPLKKKPAHFLKKIIHISYTCHNSHNSAFLFFIWKKSTPANDFYGIMKDIDLNDHQSLKTAYQKLIALNEALSSSRADVSPRIFVE